MYRYETNLFQNGRKVFTRERTLSDMDILFHTGRTGRDAFMSLINTWNRQGMIGFANHGKTYVYVAL